MRSLGVLAALALAALASVAHAEKWCPPFDLDDVAASSTAIVVARERPNGEGWEVLETWCGDLERGSRFGVQFVTSAITVEERTVTSRGRERLVATERAILFLKRGEDGGWRLVRDRWRSIVWLDRGEAFAAFADPTRTGCLSSLELDETQLHARVCLARVRRAELDAVLTIADVASRSAALARLLVDGHHEDRILVLRAMDEAGAPEPVRAIRRLLDRDSLLDHHAALLHDLLVLDGLHGPEATAAVCDVLARELSYWREHSSSLAAGFTTGVGLLGDWEELEIKARLERLGVAIARARDEAPTTKELLALRELWSSSRILREDAPQILRALGGSREIDR